MEAVKVKFENFTRIHEVAQESDNIDRIIADAVKKVVDSTPHRVTYDVTESDVIERKWLKEKRTHRTITLSLTVKIPVELKQ